VFNVIQLGWSAKLGGLLVKFRRSQEVR